MSEPEQQRVAVGPGNEQVSDAYAAVAAAAAATSALLLHKLLLL